MPSTFDTSELDALARELALAPLKIMPALVPVAHKAGAKIKADIRRNASGHSRLPHLARAVSYDVSVGASEVEVEVGFDKVGQGNLGNIAVYGTDDTAPFVDIDTPLHSEVPAFMRWVAAAAVKAL